MPTEQLRAWVDYYRDLGVHEFYRRDGGQDLAALSEETQNAAPPAAPEAAAIASRGEPVVAPVSAPPDEHDTQPIWTTPELAVPQPAHLLSFDQLAPLPAGPVPAAERPAALKAIQDEIGDCTRCPLAYAGRHKIVFAD